jgi:UDP-glucuronate 4-epimerase
MKILLTGGAGFIGSHLSERLLDAGYSLCCVDDFNDFYYPQIKWDNIKKALDYNNFTLLEGDIRDFEFLEQCFKKHDIDLVIHLAARAGVRPSIKDPKLYAETNINGTINLLELAYKYKIQNFIFASSSSVYGNNKKVPFTESDNLEGMISPYAVTKRTGEQLCFNYNHLYGLPTTCLRFFTVYGPRQRPDMAIHKFTELIYNGKEIPVFGDGSSERDYTFINDIIDGIIAVITKKYPFEIFNLGECQTTKLSYLINMIESSLGLKAKLKFLPNQPGDVDITNADISKSRNYFGYNPTTKVKDGIPLFIEWFLEKKNKSRT